MLFNVPCPLTESVICQPISKMVDFSVSLSTSSDEWTRQCVALVSVLMSVKLLKEHKDWQSGAVKALSAEL